MKNLPKRILIIDDNVDPLTLAVIRCLGIANCYVIYVLNIDNRLLPSYRFSKYVKSYFHSTAIHDEEVYLLVEQICKKIKADIIIPVKEKTVRIIAERIDKCLEFTSLPPLPDTTTLELVRNKWLLYNWLYEKKLIFEKPVRLDRASNTSRINHDLRYPLLIKPNWGSGGRGITLIRNSDELVNYKPGKDFEHEEFIIQSLIPGFDIDISALVEKGEILSFNIQRNIAGNKKLAYSRSIEFLHNDSLLKLAIRIFKELEYTGIAHLDFR